ncbi:RNA polymerase sigma-70 factor, ECF subfamily [Chryseobacterium arachidis]|uniref:RNA polymerase sigma-70 factor, ECF subfamily n=1 Tax=Chryseobacterium arachidis TaxID=1416778 RepID=A0A1M5H9W1_9FLAO|nr:sigma-70 family RNA polymerase sigma factor [Chryseobacterium arachidis]SHG12759.1 RNA polymerase sigma-70 factor, ECF subfamily [Chryseobacterium arachidis]
MKTTNVNISDKELLELCSFGNNSGYSILYQRYSKAVFNSVFRLVNDREDAEDILQEVFVKAFSELTSLKNTDSFGGWIKRIAINHSLTFLRKKKIYFAEIEDDKMYDLKDNELEERLALEFRIEELQNVIAELPLQIRTIVNLFLFEDMPQDEIAKTLNIPAGTVRSYYHRAKKKIFEKLTQKCQNERSA